MRWHKSRISIVSIQRLLLGGIMPQFIHFDPHDYDPAHVIARHEAAHAVLAYYYGFAIVHFRPFAFDAGWTGGVGVDTGHILGNLKQPTESNTPHE